MLKNVQAELLYLPPTSSLRFLPEGPYALGPGKFSWVGIQHGADSRFGSLNVFDLATQKNQSYELPGRPGFARPTEDPNKFFVGCERELGVYDLVSRTWDVVANGVDSDVENTIINDGTIFGSNCVFGTKDLEFKTRKAGLYLYRGEDQRLIRLRNDQICSNGKRVIDLGQAGLMLIDIDSPTRRVVRYPLSVEEGRLGEPELLIDLQELPSVPDGMVLTPDEQSAIISFYNPNDAEHGETRQYSLINGDLERIWETPKSPQATCPLLLEDAQGSIKLIITTAVEHMSAERQSQHVYAGGLFYAETTFCQTPIAPRFPLAACGLGK